jgi:outer membrane protein TolC
MRRTCVAGLVALLVAPLVRGQELTEEEFLAGIDGGHAAVRALTAGTAAAAAAEIRARTPANPRLDYWSERPDANARVTNWTLAWQPPLDGRYGLGKRAAAAGAAAARERHAAGRAEIRRVARKAFADWSLAEERAGILRRQHERVAALADYERERARAGEGSGLTARRLALAEAEARAALRAAEAGLALAAAGARALRADLPAEARPAAVALPAPPDLPDPASAPETAALAREAEQAAFEARRASRFLGFPTLQVGWQTIEDSGASDGGPIVAAGWSIPLFDRNRADRVEAAGRKEAAEARHSLALAGTAAAAAGGLDAYRTLSASVGEALDAARETDRVIEAATAAFRAGEAGLTDLLETLRSALEARLRAIDARGGALEVHRDLEAILGRPLRGKAAPEEEP